MTLRADLHDEASGTVVRLSGRLEADLVPDVEALCVGVQGPLRIDLTDLLSADPAGLELLRTLASKDAKLEGVSPYLAIRLGLGLAGEEAQTRHERVAARPSINGRRTGLDEKENR